MYFYRISGVSVSSDIELPGLFPAPARVREMLDTPKDLAELCTSLTAEFDVTPEDCRAEIETFLADLEQRGAISRQT